MYPISFSVSGYTNLDAVDLPLKWAVFIGIYTQHYRFKSSACIKQRRVL